MSELSQQRIDVSKIKIVPDASSFTGYAIASMDKENLGDPGLPASVFEVALWKDNQRLLMENIKLRNLIDKLRVMVHGYAPASEHAVRATPANTARWSGPTTQCRGAACRGGLAES